MGLALMALAAAPAGAVWAQATSSPSGCDYASHPGLAGSQFRHLTLQAQTAAIELCRQGILTGTAPDLFSPYLPVTRAQAVKFVVRAKGLPLQYPARPTFQDVSRQSPYYAYIETAYAAGLLPFANAGGDFLPTEPIARDTFAVLAVQALGDASKAESLAGTATPYRDDAAIPAQDRGAVVLALRLGIVPPYTRTLYDPSGKLMRVGFALGIERLDLHLHGPGPITFTLSAEHHTIAPGQSDILVPNLSNAHGGALSVAQLAARGYRLTYSVNSADAQVTPDAYGDGSFSARSPGAYTVTATLTSSTGATLSAQATITVTQPVESGSLKVQVLQEGQAGAGFGSAREARVEVMAVAPDGQPLALQNSQELTVTFTPSAGAPEVSGLLIPKGESATILEMVSAAPGTFAFEVHAGPNLAAGNGTVVFSPSAAQVVRLSPAAPAEPNFLTTGSPPFVGLSTASQTFTAQVANAHGVPVPDRGVTIRFTLKAGPNRGSAVLTGLTQATVGPGQAASVDATTNGSGVATVTLQPQADNGDRYELSASANGLASSGETALVVQAPVHRALSLRLETATGQSVSQVAANPDTTVTAVPSLTRGGMALTSADLLQATVTGATLSAGSSRGAVTDNGQSLTFTWKPGVTFNLVPSSVGTVRVTLTDLSDPSRPTASAALTVVPGVPFRVTAESSLYQGGRFTAAQAGVYGPFAITLTDFGLNPVSDPEPVTLTAGEVAQLVAGSAASQVTAVSADQNGAAALPSIVLPSGVEAVDVYVRLSGPAVLTASNLRLSTADPIATVRLSGDAGRIDNHTAVRIAFTTPLHGLPTGTVTHGIGALEATPSAVAVEGLVSLNGDYALAPQQTSTTLETQAAVSANGQVLTLTVGGNPPPIVVTTQPSAAKGAESGSITDLAGHPLGSGGAAPSLSGTF